MQGSSRRENLSILILTTSSIRLRGQKHPKTSFFNDFCKIKKLKRLQKWDARVHLTRDLKQLNQHDELYQITLSKTPKNVIFQKWYSLFFYHKTSQTSRNDPEQNKSVTKLSFDQIFKDLKITPTRF